MKRIKSLELRGQNYRKGFTLIELLIAMSVVVVVGSILGAIILSSLQGANKTTSISSVRQNGNFAISQMSKMIRDAQRVDSPVCTIPPSPTPTLAPVRSITITSLDGFQTTFDCSGTTISSNSASLLDTSTVSLSSCSISCIQTNLDSPTVGISFTLIKAAATIFEQRASISFHTTVSLRSANR